MSERKTVILEKAIEISCACTHPLKTELVAIEESLSRVTASKVFCNQEVPSFSRSIMDGFTLTEPDLVRLTEGNTLELPIVDLIPAGCARKVQFSPGQTTGIMTGAVVPDNTAAIIKQEDVWELGEHIRLNKLSYKGENIDPPGSEIKAGEMIVNTGQLVDAGIIERLAVIGKARVNVYTLPRVYIINCGSELCLPGKALSKGQVYNSNRNLMLAQVQGENCYSIIGKGPIADDIELIAREIETGIKQGDILIISGGTSQGKYDLVADALKQLGSQFLFHSIEAKPGRNVSCSLLKGCLVFNLPGRPSAGRIIFDLLLAPVLRKMKGLTDYNHYWINLPLSDEIARKCEARSFLWGELIQKDCNLLARPLAKHEKSRGRIPLLLDLKPGQGSKGDVVKAILVTK